MMRLKKKGFTLVEIMIVIAILGLLAAIAIPNFITARTAAQTKMNQINAEEVYRAQLAYCADEGVDPLAEGATWTKITPWLEGRVAPANIALRTKMSMKPTP